MSHRPCAQCGAVFREPDDNDEPVRCYACGATFPSFNADQAMAAMVVPLTCVEAPADAPPVGPSIVGSIFNLPRGEKAKT